MSSDKPLTDVADSRCDEEISCRITDLIALEKLQCLQDAFAKSSNVASTLTDPDGKPITVATRHTEKHVEIEIADTGAGIAPELLDKMTSHVRESPRIPKCRE